MPLAALKPSASLILIFFLVETFEALGNLLFVELLVLLDVLLEVLLEVLLDVLLDVLLEVLLDVLLDVLLEVLLEVVSEALVGVSSVSSVASPLLSASPSRVADVSD